MALQLLGYFRTRQRFDLYSLRPTRPLQLGDKRPQRVALVQRVQSVCNYQRDRVAARVARQEREQVARRAVDPVHVLDDQEHRTALREPRRTRPPRTTARVPPDHALDGTSARPQPRQRRPERAGQGSIASPSSITLRSAEIIGENASSPSASSTHSPVSTTAPAARARVSNSATSRLLPMPASPATRIAPPVPAAARWRSCREPRARRAGPRIGAMKSGPTSHHRAWRPRRDDHSGVRPPPTNEI